MRYTIIGIALLLIGCNPDPKDEDVYENKLTRERVKIDVGDCNFLEDMQNTWNNIADSVAKDLNYTRIQMIREEDYKPIKHDYLMTSRKCVGYEEKDDLGNLRNVTYYVIKDIDDFKEEFNPVK